MKIERMAQAIYAAVMTGRQSVAWDVLPDDDGPTGFGKRAYREWAEAAAAVPDDVVEVEVVPVEEAGLVLTEGMPL